MKIIKEGKKTYRLTCSKCGCEFEYELNEIGTVIPGKVECPCCGEYLYHPNQDIKINNVTLHSKYILEADKETDKHYTHRQALNIIKDQLINDGAHYEEDLVKGINKLEELVDKEDTTEPIISRTIGKTLRGKCPECGRTVDSDMKYCPSCGQHLEWAVKQEEFDWGEPEEKTSKKCDFSAVEEFDKAVNKAVKELKELTGNCPYGVYQEDIYTDCDECIYCGDCEDCWRKWLFEDEKTN